jgi:CrcB protein
VHLHWRSIALVFVGGSIGTAARYVVSSVVPTWQGIPVGTVLINIAGAFALGILLESLIRRGPDEGTRRSVRLLLGTGVLGGFTTYSSFAVDADQLLAGHHVWGGAVYAAATLIIGAIASTAGITVANVLHRRRGIQK